MISMCISECGNNGKWCPSCGRTLTDRMDWKVAVEDNDTATFERIKLDCKERLTNKEHKHWLKKYEAKKKKLNK